MKLKFKTGLLASLGAVAFTPIFACSCGQSISITKRIVPLVWVIGATKEIETYVVNNDTTICYLTLPEFMRMYSDDFTMNLKSYSNGIYIYENNDALCKIDTVKDTISFTNPNDFFEQDIYIQYGYEPIVNFQLDEEQSKIVSLGEKEEGYYKAFDLAKYNFDILDLNGQAALIPFEPLSYVYATTNVSLAFSYDREKFLLNNEINILQILTRKTPPSDINLLNYNYDCLRFLFDYNYGLKGKRYIKDYDTFFKNATFKIDDKYMTYYDALHDTEGYAYASRAIVSLIESECDDGHSSYSFAPCREFAETVSDAQKEYRGPRVQNLYDLTNHYTEQFNQKKSNYQWIQNPNIEEEYNFLTFVHGDDATKPKAVLKFDMFNTSMSSYYKRAVEEFGPNLDFSNLDVLEFFEDSTNVIQFLWADYKIKEYNNTHTDAPIKDVIIDISNNGGGAVRSLVELLGFVSDDGIAKMSWLKTATNDFVDSAVKVDTNFDGVFDEKDGYGDVYNFYIVDSGFSFSCGNAFPYFANINYGIPLIGNKSGGGSCWVSGGMSLPYGDIFNISSTVNFGFLHGNYFYDVDDGIVPNYQLLQDYYYDYESISNIIDSMA